MWLQTLERSVSRLAARKLDRSGSLRGTMVHRHVMSKGKRIRKGVLAAFDVTVFTLQLCLGIYIYVYNVNIMCILYSSLHHQHVATCETWIPFEGCKEIGARR